MKKLFFLILLIAVALCDVYMHNPRGSNNRLNEQSANANNQNRLFDSQNNAAGGYCWGPPMYFYTGSLLSIEWTNQHSCGMENAHCEIILQFMCANGVRDGNTTTTITDSVTQYNMTVANSTQFLYGMHEDYFYYTNCQTRERNKGLFIADQNMNGQGATATRQNNNGNRHGFECPEERDYYPYWHPQPWIDIAVLTTETSRCAFYQQNSHNVKAVGYCQNQQYNNPTACPRGQWLTEPPLSSQWGSCVGAPVCIGAPFNRDNHLGNGINGYTNSYNWTIPSCVISKNCVLRIRYNISTFDYNDWGTFASSNGAEVSPVKQDPYVDPFDSPGGATNLSLALNTAQYGRTFQDRSYTFEIRKRPGGLDGSTRIFNLNVRGKRGNIVQAYPAVEYDFVPIRLMVRSGDYIHMQWTGCDTNPQNFAGEGRDGTDRSNMVQTQGPGFNYPADWNLISGSRLFPNYAMAYRAAYLDQTNCLNFTALNNGNDDQNPQNCMKLNAASPYMDLGLYKVSFQGKAYYISSRNNNFSNRSQKGEIISNPALQTFGVVIVSVGSAAFFVAMVFAVIAGINAFAASSPFANIPIFNAE